MLPFNIRQCVTLPQRRKGRVCGWTWLADKSPKRADNKVTLKQGWNIWEGKKCVRLWGGIGYPQPSWQKILHCPGTDTLLLNQNSCLQTTFQLHCTHTIHVHMYVHVNRTHSPFLPSIQPKWCMQGSVQQHESDLHPVVCLNASHTYIHRGQKLLLLCHGPLLVPLLRRHSGTKSSQAHHIPITSGFYQTVSNGVIVLLAAQYNIFRTVLFCFTSFCCEHLNHVEKDKYCLVTHNSLDFCKTGTPVTQ